MIDAFEAFVVVIYLIVGLAIYAAMIVFTVGAWALGIAQIVGWVVGS